MVDRISSIHLKQFIVRLINDEPKKAEALALLDRHINTVKSDKNDLVEGLQQLLNHPEDGISQARELISRFGKPPLIIFSNTTRSK